MSAVKLIAVFVENQPGQTARITGILQEAAVNLRWVTIANNGSFGVMKFLVDRRDEAVAALRAQGLMVSLLDVLAVEVPDKPGALQGVAAKLGAAGLNLHNCSGYVTSGGAVLLVELSEIERARTVLTQQGIRLLEQEELLRA